MKKSIILMLLLIGAMVSHAQDKVYLKGERQPLDVKVLEVGPNEVKVQDNENDLVQVFETFDVYKIVFANGRVQKFESENDQNLDKYRDMNFNAFSIDLASALGNNLRISYDRVLKPGLSYELAATYIGLSSGRIIAEYGTYDPNTYTFSDQLYQGTRGFRVEGGMKAIRLPNFVNGRIRYRHLLQGSYIKPWAAIENVSQEYVNSIYLDQTTNETKLDHERRSYTSLNLGLDFGKSWVASNRFLVDVYFGLGYSISGFNKVNAKPVIDDAGLLNYIYDSYDDVRGYGYLRTQPSRTGSFILRAGVKFGYVFNWKRDAEKNFQR